jgi:hypothetical protein
MTPSELTRIKDWAGAQTHLHDLFLSDSPHPRQPAFDVFGAELTRAAPCIRITRSDRPCEIPAFFIGGNILFSALPRDMELMPFLEALSFAASPPPLPGHIRPLLNRISRSGQLTLFISAQCPHCPDMVRRLIPPAVHSQQMGLNIIDGTLFPEMAEKHRILSVPCLILEPDLRWTGHVDLKEILTQMNEQNPSQLSAATFRQVLEQGEADRICRQMIQADTLFQGFIDLLLHPEWSVRLGAMVVVEALAEQAPKLAARLCPVLMQAFDDIEDISIQGDVLYALGEAGGPETREWIQHMLPGLDHPDLKEAALEALAAIDDKRM